MATGRAISEEFLLDFCDTGDLSCIVEYIKEHTELNFCFRGNDGNKHGHIVIYKNNHMVVRISKYVKKNHPKFKMDFDFNHARYSKEWKSYLKSLNEIGWCFKFADESLAEIGIGEIHYKIKDVDSDKIKQSLDIFCKLIDDFFDLNLDYDYFKKIGNVSKDDMREKEAQHELHAMKVITASKAEYLVYDLEFTEKEKKKGNKPDFFALKSINGIVDGLVIGEVKSKKGAFNGESGLIKHLDGMCNQMETFNKNDERILEASKILSDYAKLNLKGLANEDIKKFTDENFLKAKFVEIAVVLTDDAIKAYDNKSGRGKPTYRSIFNDKYKDKSVVVKKFENGKFEDI